MLATNTVGQVDVVDAFGQSYGYSYHGKGRPGIWSTGRDTNGSTPIVG